MPKEKESKAYNREFNTDIPVTKALEFAFAAHRINNGYINESVYSAKIFSNRDLVKNAMRKHIGVLTDEHISSDLTVTDQDRLALEDLGQIVKKYMFKSLAGKLSSFQNDSYTLMCRETTRLSSAGLIAYIPELIRRDKIQWDYEKLLKDEYSNSSVLNVGESVKGRMKILQVRKLTSKRGEPFTITVAGMNGNLFQFSKDIMYENDVGQTYSLSGRVSKTSIEYYTHIPLTVLNYVRLNND